MSHPMNLSAYLAAPSMSSAMVRETSQNNYSVDSYPSTPSLSLASSRSSSFSLEAGNNLATVGAGAGMSTPMKRQCPATSPMSDYFSSFYFAENHFAPATSACSMPIAEECEEFDVFNLELEGIAVKRVASPTHTLTPRALPLAPSAAMPVATTVRRTASISSVDARKGVDMAPVNGKLSRPAMVRFGTYEKIIY
ncbi:hypothetical protein YB2330_006550 [Saitoella coloradoensis]